MASPDSTHLYLKARELLLGGEPGDWLMAAIGLGLVVTVLVMFQWFWVWVAMGVVAAGLAVGPPLHPRPPDRPGTRRPARPDRGDAQGTPKLRGQGEDPLHQFVCKFGGERWEEFFEALFGYEAKLAARRAMGAGREAVPVPGSPPGASRSSPGSRSGCGHAARPTSGHSCNGSRRRAWSLKG